MKRTITFLLAAFYLLLFQAKTTNSQEVILFEDFDGVTPPALPEGWVAENVSETSTTWLTYGALHSEFNVGTDPLLIPDNIKVYPNPASADINIRWDGPDRGKAPVEYRIADTSGRVVISGYFNDNNYTLSLEGILSGMYILYLEKPDGAVRTFLIEKI